ncbi:MAG TPA: N-acyl homoserine lactonase family protein [Solirubrobacteraceae bacterium]|jgi:glyoxylase-like metal-dependent hydrolase (beta-lactamase superfamily II)
MSQARATPIDLPLPGGQAGASVTLHPLLCAEMIGPPGWFHRLSGPSASLKALGIGVPRSEYIRVPIVAFLIEHPSAGAILIDTGFHASAITRSHRNLGLFGALTTRGIKMQEDGTVAAQCRGLGVDPATVALIVMTHLHFDHASALADFPGATVLVSEPEWKSAVGPGAGTRGYVRAQLDPRPSYRTIDFSDPNASRRGPFDLTLDLLGDGSIVALFTPGHSAGHMSIIVRLSNREALIAGDAIYTMATLREDERPWRSEDSSAFERSLSALKKYDQEHPDALIIPGHDMDAWERLEPSYT